jgi:hypothetical protein
MEEASDIHDSSKLNLAGSKIEIEDEYTYSPINELGLQVDPNNPRDKEELNMILVGILNYPSDTLASFHADAMKLGNFDLESETKKEKEKEQVEQ